MKCGLKVRVMTETHDTFNSTISILYPKTASLFTVKKHYMDIWCVCVYGWGGVVS